MTVYYIFIDEYVVENQKSEGLHIMNFEAQMSSNSRMTCPDEKQEFIVKISCIEIDFSIKRSINTICFLKSVLLRKKLTVTKKKGQKTNGTCE